MKLQHSIRWKAALACMLLTLGPIVFLNRHAVKGFDDFTRKDLEEKMIDYATVIGEEFLDVRDRKLPAEDYAARLRKYGGEFQARLQIAGKDGKVMFDSSDPPATGADYGEHREVQRALAGKYGARWALSDDRLLMFYYIAVPVRNSEGEVVAAACVRAHTKDITRAILGMTRDYRGILVISVSMAILVSVLLAHAMTRRLRALTTAARSFARGESTMSAKVSGRDEIGVLSRAFAQMAREIRKTHEQNQRLMAETTHELKTPLTAIQGAVQVLRDEGADEDPASRKRFLDNIAVSSDRLLCMVEQLNALSKLKAEDLRGKKEKVDYGAFIRSAVSRLFPHPKPRIELDLPANEIEARIIPERIEQVLANLLENAIRYTPEEGTIGISVRRDENEIITVVRDSGKGIEPSDLPKVFQQFFTTVSRNSLRDYGNGLGLAIARTIVQNHGGRIMAESEPGKGSAFTFVLPL